MKTIVAAGMSVAVFGSILTIYTGFSEVDPEKVKLIYTLGGNKRDVKLPLPLFQKALLSKRRFSHLYSTPSR